MRSARCPGGEVLFLVVLDGRGERATREHLAEQPVDAGPAVSGCPGVTFGPVMTAEGQLGEDGWADV